MKRTQTLGICLLLALMILTGCSKESLLERVTGLLDELFAGDAIAPIPSAEDPEEAPEPEPEPDQAQEPDIPASEEPDIPDPDKPAVPGDPGSTASSEPGQTSAPVQPQTSAPSDTTGASITPSHTDVTFFSAGESFSYQPKGTAGVYACTYTSDNEKVATVDEKTGRVTAAGPGTTNIKMHVECNGQYDFSCVVRCNWKEDKADQKDGKQQPAVSSNNNTNTGTNKNDEPPLPPAAPASSGTASGVTASHSDATFFNPKEHFTLSAKGAGDDSDISYTTSDASVASVSQSGVVTAVGPGTATVTMSVDCGGTEYIFDCIVRCSW